MADDRKDGEESAAHDTAPLHGGGKRDAAVTLPSDEPRRVAEAEVKVVKICKRCMVSQAGGGGFCVKCGEELVPIRSVRGSAVGELVAGKYKIVEPIGSGGMGEVYLGVNEPLGQRVAVKFLSHKFTADEGVIMRFLNEARSYCRVNHPHAVTLLEYGQHDDGSLYLITEFIEGKSLTDTVKERGPLSIEQALSIGVQCCGVLSAAHRQGVIHRDLKPDNIMLTPAPRGRFTVKVLDFGIAKIVDDDGGVGPMTETGSIFGTPEFMSPEQARGDAADPRSDLYAMGIILFFLVTGKLPFRGKNKFAILNQHLNDAPPRPSQVREDAAVPAALEAVILKCLSKGAGERFQSADDLAEALEAIEPGRVPSAGAAREASAAPTTVPTLDLNPRAGEGSAAAMSVGGAPFEDAPFGEVPFRESGAGGTASVSMEMTGPEGAVDVFAPTLGGELSDENSDPRWSETGLEALDLSLERGDEDEALFEAGALGAGRRGRRLAALALLTAAAAVLASGWYFSGAGRAPKPAVIEGGVESGIEGGVEGGAAGLEGGAVVGAGAAMAGEADLERMLVTGQVLGLLEAVENMIETGELGSASKTLESTRALLERGGAPEEAGRRFEALVARHRTAENVQRRIRAAVAANRCGEADRLLETLGEASRGLRAQMAEQVAGCGRPATVQAAPAPKPAAVEAPPEKAPVVEPAAVVPAEPVRPSAPAPAAAEATGPASPAGAPSGATPPVEATIEVPGGAPGTPVVADADDEPQTANAAIVPVPVHGSAEAEAEGEDAVEAASGAVSDGDEPGLPVGPAGGESSPEESGAEVELPDGMALPPRQL